MAKLSKEKDGKEKEGLRNALVNEGLLLPSEAEMKKMGGVSIAKA